MPPASQRCLDSWRSRRRTSRSRVLGLCGPGRRGRRHGLRLRIPIEQAPPTEPMAHAVADLGRALHPAAIPGVDGRQERTGRRGLASPVREPRAVEARPGRPARAPEDQLLDGRRAAKAGTQRGRIPARIRAALLPLTEQRAPVTRGLGLPPLTTTGRLLGRAGRRVRGARDADGTRRRSVQRRMTASTPRRSSRIGAAPAGTGRRAAPTGR
jgi:hypothetical protein